jgi:hypothetical protein
MKTGFEQKETKATENPLPPFPLLPPVENQSTAKFAADARYTRLSPLSPPDFDPRATKFARPYLRRRRIGFHNTLR